MFFSPHSESGNRRKKLEHPGNFLRDLFSRLRCYDAGISSQSFTGRVYDDSSGQQVTQLLLTWNQGDDSALERLIPVVYAELPTLGASLHEGRTCRTHVANHGPGPRGLSAARSWQTGELAKPSSLLRRLGTAHAADTGGLGAHSEFQKRGGSPQRVTLDDALMMTEHGEDLVALDEALKALAEVDLRKSEVVEMRFFGD